MRANSRRRLVLRPCCFIDTLEQLLTWRLYCFGECQRFVDAVRRPDALTQLIGLFFELLAELDVGGGHLIRVRESPLLQRLPACFDLRRTTPPRLRQPVLVV